MIEHQQPRMSLSEHFEELRGRLMWAVIGLGVATVLCWIVKGPIMKIVVWPLRQANFSEKLMTLSPMESVLQYLKVCIVSGMLLSSPWIAYQLWKFVGAGLYPEERRFFHLYAGGSALLFAIGVAFSYFLMIPLITEILISFDPAKIREQKMQFSEYISFFFKMTIAMGISFQVPMLMRFLSAMGIVDRPAWKSYRKYAYVGSFFLAALITPPDPISQSSAALPIILLYEAGILLTPSESDSTMEDSSEESTGSTDANSKNGEDSSED